jgi:hypothetical protein
MHEAKITIRTMVITLLRVKSQAAIARKMFLAKSDYIPVLFIT